MDVGFSAPIVALVSRPANGHWLNQRNLDVSHNFLRAAAEGQMEFIWSSPRVLATVEWRRMVSDRIGVCATYTFSYVSSREPDPLLSMGAYQNDLLLGFEWRL
jgi:hypothetical protein